MQLAKLSSPRLPPVAPRERLFQRLDALHEIPCRWICGPAGSGKTTLVADYLRCRGIANVWFHVDEGDHDPAAAISYLISLARSVHADADALPFLTMEHMAAPASFHRQFFRRFHQCLPPRCAIVFDNCHRAAGPAFLTMLQYAIDEAPPGVVIFATSRERLPDALVPAFANRQVAVLGEEDLRLDVEEARAVMAAMETPPDAAIEGLHAMSGGWVAGLVLMLSQGALPRLAERGLDRLSREAVFAYFTNELLRTEDPALRDLLVQTALLPEVTAEGARELTGNEHADELLDGLYRRHFFTQRRDTGTGADAPSYVYHDLFREYLLKLVATDLDAGRLPALREKVAAMLERAGLVAEAIEQRRLIGAWDDVVRLIRREAEQLIDEGRFRTLGDRLRGLPPERISDDPWLLFYRGHAEAATNPNEAQTLFVAAYGQFVSGGDDIGQFRTAFAAMETMLMSLPSYKPLDRWIDVLVGLLEANPPEEPVEAVRAWHTLLYSCLYRRPGHPLIQTAVDALDRALFSGRLPPTHAIRAATGLIAYAHFSCNETLAARVLPVLERCVEDDQVAIMSRVLGAGWTTVYHYFDGRYARAEQTARTATEMAAKRDFAANAGIQAWYVVQSMAHQGRWQDALAEAARLRSPDHVSGRHAPVCYADTSEAAAHFRAGDLPRAIALAESGLAAWREIGFVPAGFAWAQSMLVIYRLAAGEIETAVGLLSEAESALADTVCTYHIALHHLLHAHVALATGCRDEAIRRLKACLAHADNHKSMGVLSWARPFLPELFALAWKEGIGREWLAEAIEEWEIPPPSRNEQHWPRPLEIFVLGGFEVKRRGIRLDFGRKPPRRLISLLKAIAISGDRGLPSDTACGYLWPDLDGDAAAASLTAALYRLRKLLGSPDAVRLVEGRLMLPPEATWVDLHAFERLARSDAAADLEKALAIHRGALLPDDDEPWVSAIRIRVRDAFVRLVEALAGPMEDADADVAERLYLRGVEADPLAEGCYRGLMRCHARRGQIAEVASVYRRLRQTLSVILGIEPSAETERLRRRIIEGAGSAAW